MQILHYNNDFEIDKMCLRNWCALENNYTCCIPSGKVIWKLKHSRKLFFPYFLLELEEMPKRVKEILFFLHYTTF